MYRFRITVEPIDATTAAPLRFEAESHDDILAIASHLHGKLGLAPEESKQFAAGLKLFGEIVLRHRNRSPFDQIRPAMAEFMKTMKEQVRKEVPQLQ